MLDGVYLAQALVDVAGVPASAASDAAVTGLIITIKVIAETPLDEPGQRELVEARGELYEQEQCEQRGSRGGARAASRRQR